MGEPVNHPSDPQLDAFLKRTATASEIASTGVHLQECAGCRARVEARAGAADGIAGLYRSVAQALSEEHLHAEEVQVLALGGPSPERLRTHLERCAACRAEVDDLKKFIGARRRPRSFGATTWMAIAAVIVAAVSMAAWWMTRPVSSLPPEYASMVAQARSTEKLNVAPAVAALRGKREFLLGELMKGSGFSLVNPVGEATLSDRPRFSWVARPGADSYRVNIYDDNFRKVAESADLYTTSWTPAEPLAAGRVYSWTVTARVGKDEVREPVPPAPEARFMVLPAADAERLREAAAEYPGEHLLLAALYANAGAIEDARRELKQLRDQDPSSDLARRLGNSLDGR